MTAQRQEFSYCFSISSQFEFPEFLFCSLKSKGGHDLQLFSSPLLKVKMTLVFETDQQPYSTATSCQWVTKLISETKHIQKQRCISTRCERIQLFKFYMVTKTSFYMFFTTKKSFFFLVLVLVLMNMRELRLFSEARQHVAYKYGPWGLTAWAQTGLQYRRLCDPGQLRSPPPPHFLICNPGILMVPSHRAWRGDTECLKQCLAMLVRIKYTKPLFPEIPHFSNWNRDLK